MKLLIVDNEVNLRNGLKLLVENYCPGVTQIREADGVKSGLEAIAGFNPDIILLDIEMDDGTGFDLVRQVSDPQFQLIFVTAHNQYAIDAFRFSAIDYLLKPVDPDELKSALAKAITQVRSKDIGKQIEFLLAQESGKHEQDKRIALKDINNVYFVKVSDILFCEAEGTYTRFHLVGKEPILVSKHLKEYESILEPMGFLRTHHSFLANPVKINMYDKTDGGALVLEGGHTIPVSQRKKDAILAMLEGKIH